MTISDLYPYFILIGASILAATARVLYRSREQAKRGQELVQLNERISFDLPDFLKQCWPVLERGGFVGLDWRLEWFGAAISGESGVLTEKVLYQHFEVQEINLDIRLYHNKRGWDQRFFSQLMADTFFLLLRMDIWIKLGTVRGTFDQTAKMTVFLQHDMKNLMQLVSLAAGQLDRQVPGQEEKLIASLKKTVPSIRDRTQHMLNALVSSKGSGKKDSIDVSAAVQNVASLFELPVVIFGSATASISNEALQSILENLLGNYATMLLQKDALPQDLQISIEQNSSTVKVQIEDRLGKPVKYPERLFEPFWSEHGRGRGIGLYQSRQLVTAEGGSLVAFTREDQPLRFVLTLLASQ